MQTHIPKEFEDFIQHQLSSGKFRSEDEILTEAMRIFRQREEKRDALRSDLRKGLDSIDRDEGIEVGNERELHQFFDGLKKKASKRLQK